MSFQKTLYTFIFACLLQSGVSAQNDATIKLNSFYDSLSYILGVENAANLTVINSEFALLNKIETVRGFQEHLFGEEVEEECEQTLEDFLGNQGSEFNAEFVNEGSQCIGAYVGFQFYTQMNQIEYLEDMNMSLVLQGFQKGLFEEETLFSAEQRQEFIGRFTKIIEDNFVADVERRDQLFWEEVLKNPDLEQIGKTGIYVETIEAGTGDYPTEYSDIDAHYILTNTVGDTLENSYDRGESLKINLSMVIVGWTKAFPALQKGGKYRLFIPWEMAYRDGNPQGPRGALCFYIEFIDFGPAGTIYNPPYLFDEESEEE